MNSASQQICFLYPYILLLFYDFYPYYSLFILSKVSTKTLCYSNVLFRRRFLGIQVCYIFGFIQQALPGMAYLSRFTLTESEVQSDEKVIICNIC